MRMTYREILINNLGFRLLPLAHHRLTIDTATVAVDTIRYSEVEIVTRQQGQMCPLDERMLQ